MHMQPQQSGGRIRRILSLRPIWATYEVPGQHKLCSENLVSMPHPQKIPGSRKTIAVIPLSKLENCLTVTFSGRVWHRQSSASENLWLWTLVPTPVSNDCPIPCHTRKSCLSSQPKNSKWSSPRSPGFLGPWGWPRLRRSPLFLAIIAVGWVSPVLEIPGILEYSPEFPS